MGEATCRVPTGSPWGNSRVPTHNTDVRIVLTLVGGGEAKFYGNAEVAGRSLAVYEHHAALLRGPNEAPPRQDQTAAAPTVPRETVSMERRDRRKKKLAKEEAERVETREAQAAQATTRAASSHVHSDEDEAVNTMCAVPIEEAEQQTESVMDMEGDDRAAAQQEGEDRVLPTMTNEDVCVVETSLEEVPETLVDEHEQALPAYEDSEEEEDELSSLAQQPEVAEEAASDTGVMDGRGTDEVEGRVDVHEVVQHCFNFPSKRERKLSDEEQQEEAKRPKSPEREGVQLAEQHGSGGECGPQFRFGLWHDKGTA